jgi:hypothetical protein
MSPTELSGVGQIFAGDVLLRQVQYKLTTDGGDETSGDSAEPRIRGQIDLQGMPEAIVLAGAQELVLRLEDGRRLTFLLTNTMGSVVGVGGLMPPEDQPAKRRDP